MRKSVAALLFLLLALPALAANTLRIISAGPVGETATLAEANEIRAVFSEPMVVLGKIPQPVTASFFHITPAVKGTFRWSGTTTLIFTPDKPLPYATQYSVSVDKSAKSVAGNTLDQPYEWTFSTPAIRLRNTDWYRKTNGAIIIALRFNQPVKPDLLLPHVKLRTVAHNLELPQEPKGEPAFEAKKAKAIATAQEGGQTVFAGLATQWDLERFPKSNDLVVLETKPNIPFDTHVEVLLDEQLAATPTSTRAGSVQTYVIELPQTLFATGMDCLAECDPESRNGINFRSGPGLKFAEVQKAVSVVDVTDPAKETPLKPKKIEAEYDYPSWGYGLDELGFAVQPGRRYRVRVDPSLTAEDGQKLGYPFTATVEYWNKSAFVSFGSGHGVWEASGGPILPFHARNFRSVKQWLAPMTVDKLMPTMRKLRDSGFNVAPDAKPTTRKLTLGLNKISYLGLDLKPVIGDDNVGLAWVGVQPGDTMPKSKVYDPSVVSTLVQATNLGISVKDSPQNTLVMVTRLDDAKPVQGATVSIRDKQNKVVWTGPTDASGLAIAPNTDLRRDSEQRKSNPEYEDDYWTALGDLHFVVIAEKDGDVAYVGSDWNEGVSPWEFDAEFNLNEAEPQFRGTVFADRGVYKLGEEVHLKLIARADTPNGMQLLAPGTKVSIVVRDAHSKEIDTRTVEVNAWSTAEWTFRVPADSPLGNYAVAAKWAKHRGTIGGEFLVAAYRRPEFRVDTTLGANSSIAGTKLNGKIAGRYLFGGAMSGAAVNWTYSEKELFDVPQSISDRWPEERYAFLGRDYEYDARQGALQQEDAKLDEKGELRLNLDTKLDAGVPLQYELEGVVKDVTRQQIAGRASFRVDPAPWYIGVLRPPYFADTTKGIDTEIVAAGLDGLAVGGVTVKVQLKRLQWTSVRAAEGEGFYNWESERKEVDAGEWTITTKPSPTALHLPVTEGGEYVLTATADDGKGRSTKTRLWFYAVGGGYTAWERHDHNRIDLVPEKRSYEPGDVARIMIKSPWETATALLTTEREGVRTWKPFNLTSTQQTITVPITEKDIPNVFVSVLLVKGRTQQDPGKDGSDPGKPAFRLGYVELKVADDTKRLTVDVKANRDEFRPATKAKIDVNVKDTAGKPSQSEVTLWAVDYGVLSLTDYQTPDVLDTIYLEKALQVLNEDSRQRIISRRVMTPKGATDGGGGGRDAGAGTLRKDFRVLAFWLGSVVTDAKGHAAREITLPESLTTYRIMAVAGDKQSRFGWDNAEIRINKPLMITPAWPRFMAVGDKALFGGVVHNTGKSGGKATVSIESLDPQVLTFANSQQTVQITPGGNTEVRFDAEAKGVGVARVRLRVQMGRENDALEDTLPVRVMVSPETVAAYGEAKPRAEERIEIPADVVPTYGGLQLDLSSTAMVGLAEGARYLIEYPYGCAEQRSSRALGLMLAADLGEAFNLAEIDAGKGRQTVQAQLNELQKFQCGDGGFSFWPGDCGSTSPYLTSYVLHVFQRAQGLKYEVNRPMLESAYTFLEQKLAEPPPANEGWKPAYNAWQAFSIKVLAQGKRNVDSHLERVYGYRDRMPVFALAFLVDALEAKGETKGARMTELRRRITNSILPEGGHAFVNELKDPYLLWLWSSNERSTAIVLGTLVRGGQDEELVKRMVRWLMKVRKDGRWGNTQENAWALQALVDYYQKYESETPDFTANVLLGEQSLSTAAFRGRSTEAKSQQFSMQQLLAKGRAGQQQPLVFSREGTGTLFYMMRLRYAANVLRLDALDRGFRVERSYALNGGDTPATTFQAGDLIAVTLRIRATKERRFVAVNDPIPAGTEPVEAWFATTATALAEEVSSMQSTGWSWWERGGWDYTERHDDRVNVFATRLGEGDHVFRYLVRATTAGTFVAAPTFVEEMYEPEVFGRTATAVVEVKK
ncbi:MAG TPA: alpha-2-macroglobulin family protein [Thermoanaerobaculia bacterium]|nr:alpha-2-macroglobulin family protein [Thermoanaerobaculia bacterium]